MQPYRSESFAEPTKEGDVEIDTYCEQDGSAMSGRAPITIHIRLRVSVITESARDDASPPKRRWQAPHPRSSWTPNG
jgi:hypothetical protein